MEWMGGVEKVLDRVNKPHLTVAIFGGVASVVLFGVGHDPAKVLRVSNGYLIGMAGFAAVSAVAIALGWKANQALPPITKTPDEQLRAKLESLVGRVLERREWLKLFDSLVGSKVKEVGLLEVRLKDGRTFIGYLDYAAITADPIYGFIGREKEQLSQRLSGIDSVEVLRVEEHS